MKSKKLTKSQLADFDTRWKQRNKMLKQIGLKPESFEEFLDFVFGRSKKEKSSKTPLSAVYSLKIPDNGRGKDDIYINVSKETKIVGPGDCTKRSIMDPRVLANEKPEVREAILAKSRRLMPLYNKGGYQYVTDGEDVTTLGSRSRRS
jgi:hypothetical protein